MNLPMYFDDLPAARIWLAREFGDVFLYKRDEDKDIDVYINLVLRPDVEIDSGLPPALKLFSSQGVIALDAKEAEILERISIVTIEDLYTSPELTLSPEDAYRVEFDMVREARSVPDWVANRLASIRNNRDESVSHYERWSLAYRDIREESDRAPEDAPADGGFYIPSVRAVEINVDGTTAEVSEDTPSDRVIWYPDAPEDSEDREESE